MPVNATPVDGGPSSTGTLTPRAVGRDAESRLSAVLHHTHGGENPQRDPAKASPPDSRASKSARLARFQAQCVAQAMARAIDARLAGRVRNLDVVADGERFVLHGWSNSYYVKQLAGHLAMRALEERMLGRLVNEIEVRAGR